MGLRSTALPALAPLLLVGAAHAQSGEAGPSTPAPSGGPLPVLAPADTPPVRYAHPPQHPKARLPYPFRTPSPRAARPAWQDLTRWFRLGASVGIFPLVGRLRYSFVYHGDVLDSHYGPTAPRPSVSISAEAHLARILLLGLSAQFIAVKWSQGQMDRYDSTAYEFDFLPRLGLTLPLASRSRLLVSGAAGYSMVDASGVVLGAYRGPSTLRGFVVQADAGVLFLFTPHGFVLAGASVQWGLQNKTVVSETTKLPATAELRSIFFGLRTGIGYWF